MEYKQANTQTNSHVSDTVKSTNTPRASTKNTTQTTLDSVMQLKSTPQSYPTLISWLEDSHVKHFLLQEKEEGLMTQEEHCFLKSHGFYERKSPDIFYSKTYEVYYLTTREKLSRQYLKYSPTWGIMCNGRYIIAKTMEYPKTENECTLRDILERERCTGEVLSVRGTMPETNVQGKLIPLNDKPQAQTIYDIGGVSCTLSANGGGQGGKTGLYNVTPSKYLRRVDDNRFSTGTKDNNVYALETRHRGQPFHKAQDNYVLQIKDNTKKGFHEAREGDSIQLANTTSNGKKVSSQISRTLSTSGTIATVTPGYRIRRLTPRECERLQGFPDDWTRYGATGEEMSDTQRYKMCGNAVTTNVIRDIMNDWNMTLTED